MCAEFCSGDETQQAVLCCSWLLLLCCRAVFLSVCPAEGWKSVWFCGLTCNELALSAVTWKDRAQP